jgi:hypothetical protein
LVRRSILALDPKATLSRAAPPNSGDKAIGGDANGNSAGGPLRGKLSAAAATLGAFIAVGQAGSQWIKGMSDAELAKIQATSTMAEEHLKMVISKNVTAPDKVMLLGALAGATRGEEGWPNRGRTHSNG